MKKLEEIDDDFLSYMDSMSEVYDEYPDGAFFELMRESIDNWNQAHNVNIDRYDGLDTWVRNRYTEDSK